MQICKKIIFKVLKNKVHVLIKKTVLEFNMIVLIFLTGSKRLDQHSPTYKSKENIKVQIFRFEVVNNFFQNLIYSDLNVQTSNTFCKKSF